MADEKILSDIDRILKLTGGGGGGANEGDQTVQPNKRFSRPTITEADEQEETEKSHLAQRLAEAVAARDRTIDSLERRIHHDRFQMDHELAAVKARADAPELKESLAILSERVEVLQFANAHQGMMRHELDTRWDAKVQHEAAAAAKRSTESIEDLYRARKEELNRSCRACQDHLTTMGEKARESVKERNAAEELASLRKLLSADHQRRFALLRERAQQHLAQALRAEFRDKIMPNLSRTMLSGLESKQVVEAFREVTPDVRSTVEEKCEPELQQVREESLSLASGLRSAQEALIERVTSTRKVHGSLKDFQEKEAEARNEVHRLQVTLESQKAVRGSELQEIEKTADRLEHQIDKERDISRDRRSNLRQIPLVASSVAQISRKKSKTAKERQEEAIKEGTVHQSGGVEPLFVERAADAIADAAAVRPRQIEDTDSTDPAHHQRMAAPDQLEEIPHPKALGSSSSSSPIQHPTKRWSPPKSPTRSYHHEHHKRRDTSPMSYHSSGPYTLLNNTNKSRNSRSPPLPTRSIIREVPLSEMERLELSSGVNRRGGNNNSQRLHYESGASLKHAAGARSMESRRVVDSHRSGGEKTKSPPPLPSPPENDEPAVQNKRRTAGPIDFEMTRSAKNMPPHQEATSGRTTPARNRTPRRAAPGGEGDLDYLGHGSQFSEAELSALYELRQLRGNKRR